MGEPGTKEILNLEDLEAAAASTRAASTSCRSWWRTSPACLLGLPGFSRAAASTSTRLPWARRTTTTISRITLTVDGAAHPIDQVTKQLHKLVNVIKIRDLEPEETVARELALFKISAGRRRRAQVMQFTDIFRGKIVDVSKRSVTVEVTGHRRQDRGVRGAGPPVRPHRDGAHRRDRRGARPQRHLGRGLRGAVLSAIVDATSTSRGPRPSRSRGARGAAERGSTQAIGRVAARRAPCSPASRRRSPLSSTSLPAVLGARRADDRFLHRAARPRPLRPRGAGRRPAWWRRAARPLRETAAARARARPARAADDPARRSLAAAGNRAGVRGRLRVRARRRGAAEWRSLAPGGARAARGVDGAAGRPGAR